MRHARTRAGVVLLTLAMGASCSNDDDAPTAEARTESPTTFSSAASSADADDGASPTTQPRTEPSTSPAAAPVEVTACINPGPEVHRGTEERVVVPLPDGEMTIVRGRGHTYRQSLTSVSDPRLEGTLYQAWDEDDYTLPSNEPGPNIVTFTDRIENEEGAWQASVVGLRFPDNTGYYGPMMMVGEGAYEGLTAIIAFESFGDDCAVRGYIIDGTVPPPPVPNTGP